MKTEEVTQQILGAWDEIVAADQQPEPGPEEGAVVEPPEPEQPEEPEEEEVGEEESAAPELEPGEEPEGGEEAEEPEEEEEEEPVEAEHDFLDDPEAKAWFDRYQGDPARAWKGAWELQKAFSRQGADKAYLERRVRELEAQVEQGDLFATGPTFLSDEQRTWIGEALESGQPLAYVREAVKAGEFELARAVCTEWGHEQPYEAARIAQQVDVAEYETRVQAQANESGELPWNTLVEVLTQHFPEMPQYEAQMVQALQQLGPEHPVAVDARSPDPQVAAKAIVAIYEIARTSSAALASTRAEVRNGHREKASGARKRAVVASAETSPSPSEAPRSVKLGPGLTLEQLDAEWEQNR